MKHKQMTLNTDKQKLQSYCHGSMIHVDLSVD